jgi:hypothetical protein
MLISGSVRELIHGGGSSCRFDLPSASTIGVRENIVRRHFWMLSTGNF